MNYIRKYSSASDYAGNKSVGDVILLDWWGTSYKLVPACVYAHYYCTYSSSYKSLTLHFNNNAQKLQIQ